MDFERRHDLVRLYAWAIPNEEALDTLAKLAPIVEMGAGTGYWAWLLRVRGVDVMAYDKAPPRLAKKNAFSFTCQWTGVLPGRPAKLAKYSNRTLFLCWPDYRTDFASRCIEAYTGDTVVYVGEGRGGCTGDDKFHDLLEFGWGCQKTVQIPRWGGIYDAMFVWRRKGTSHESAV